MPTLDERRAHVERLELELAKVNLAINQAHAESLKRNSAWSADGRDLNAFIRIKAGEARILEDKIRLAKNMLKLTEDGIAAKARADHLAATAHLEKNRWYEIAAPDGRVVRVQHSSRENLEKDLLPGYTFRGVVFGADQAGKGGIEALRGDLLLAFLAAHGFKPDKPEKGAKK